MDSVPAHDDRKRQSPDRSGEKDARHAVAVQFISRHLDDEDVLMTPITIPSSIAMVPPMSKDDINRKDSRRLPADLTKDSEGEIARLAGLSRLKYEEQRKIAAESLGISVTGLDAAVREERRSTSGQGKPLELFEPKPWDMVVTGPELLAELISALRRHVVMSEGETVATALWIIHCHAFTAFTGTPRLAIISPEKQRGKTTLLDLLSVLVPRPLLTANVGPAAVFRAIEKAQPTLLIDEADTFLRANDELRGILNSGHRQGGSTLRCVGDDHEPRAFTTWAPAAIAMIGRLPDTLEDRSVAVRLRRRRPKTIDRWTETGILPQPMRINRYRYWELDELERHASLFILLKRTLDREDKTKVA
jgi:hypothetical protein